MMASLVYMSKRCGLVRKHAQNTKVEYLNITKVQYQNINYTRLLKTMRKN